MWVIIDGGDAEEAIINKMQDMYAKSGWEADKFQQLQEHDFEKYYPAEFEGQVTEILTITDKQTKRKRKKQLLDDVVLWCKEDTGRARDAFEESAIEVIEVLQGIDGALKKVRQL